MKAYIRTSAAISPQASFDGGLFSGDLRTQDGEWLKALEPEYKEYINPGLSRRMSRIVKMGVAAATRCLKDAGVDIPDAIITGTGLGCMEDTGNFLTSIINNQEQFLTPTAFIQSTHNTIAGQIALMLKCNNYNFAYVHRGFSFESALLDAMMMINQKECRQILIGGIDEITSDYWNVTRRMGMWKNSIPAPDSLFGSKSRGTVAGEGASFFLLQGEAGDAMAEVSGVDMIFRPSGPEVIDERIRTFLESQGISAEELDLVITGMNGWPLHDRWYREPEKGVLKDLPLAGFKHWSGEYMTASSFALWLAANVISQEKVPEGMMIDGQSPGKPKRILICNHFMGINHTLMLVQAC